MVSQGHGIRSNQRQTIIYRFAMPQALGFISRIQQQRPFRIFGSDLPDRVIKTGQSGKIFILAELAVEIGMR